MVCLIVVISQRYWPKFIVFFSLVGYTLCHQQLAMPGVTDIWKVALQDGYCVQLFRDEVIMFHKEFQNLLDGMKGWVSERRKVHSWFCVLSRESQESDQNQFSPNIIIVNTYLAESVNGQNEANRAFWLASWASISCPLQISRIGPTKKCDLFVHLINPLLTKLVRSWWLYIGPQAAQVQCVSLIINTCSFILMTVDYFCGK